MKKHPSKQKLEPIDVSKFTTMEDLISAAMGPHDKNIVNFKMVQAILMILAQQLRMLKRPVDYRSLEDFETAQSEGKKSAERESQQSDKESETSARDSEISERGTGKIDRDKEKAERKKEKTGQEKEKTGREKEKTGRESEKTGREKEKTGRESEKTGREKEKTGRESEKTGREKEKTGRERNKTGREREKTEPEGEKTEREKEKTGQETEKTGPKKEKTEKEKSEGERQMIEQDREKTEKEKTKGERDKIKSEREKKGGEREKTEPGTEKTEKEMTEGEKEKSERENKKAEIEREKTKAEREKTEAERERTKAEGEKTKAEWDKTEREREQTGQERETTGPEKEKTEKEKTEGEGEKTKPEREKTGKEKTEGEGEKTETESEKTGKEKTEGEGEKTEPESEKTGKEKTEGEGEKTEPEREKTGKEKTEGEGEKTEPEREKTEGEKEKTEPEREKTEGEKEETEPEIEKTGKEKTEGEGEMNEPETEKTEKEMTEGEGEKTEPEREKTGKEKIEGEGEKTEPEREKTGKEKTEGEREKTVPEREMSKREKGKGREREEKDTAAVTKQGKDKPLVEETFISITDKDKVLVVENIPTSRRGTVASIRATSIPVVSLSQFKILEAAVRALEEKAAPIPYPAMPDNQTLRDDISRGNASLTDTMQAMQVAARMQAAEEAINRMAELLTDMAAKGVVPADLAGKVDSVVASNANAKTRLIKRASTTSKGAIKARQSIISMKARQSITSKSQAKVPKPARIESSMENFVTYPDMNKTVLSLKNALKKTAFDMSMMVQKTADQSQTIANNAALRAALLTGMDSRIQVLTNLLNEHGETLAGFNAGATTQMDIFTAQLGLVKNDLQDAIMQFEALNSGSENPAIKELDLKYEQLVERLDLIMTSHKDLAGGQGQQSEDMQGILACVEMLQEEKSDRDEMLDRLRDKADLSFLNNLLPATEFYGQQEKLQEKLDGCHDKFHTQEVVWEGALVDLRKIADEKADLIQLLQLKEDTENQLNEINKKLRCLAYALGEPKAALLARKLSKGARCGSCNQPALQDAIDKSYIKDAKNQLSHKPPRMPSAYFSYMGAGDPCDIEANPPTVTESTHVCNRWVGGSHTRVNASVKRTQPERLIFPRGPPTRKYTKYGDDGGQYKMEEPLAPCEDCNPQTGEKVHGAGDTDHIMPTKK